MKTIDERKAELNLLLSQISLIGVVNQFQLAESKTNSDIDKIYNSIYNDFSIILEGIKSNFVDNEI